MKNFIYLLLISLLAFSLTNCKKETTPDNNPNKTSNSYNGEMKITITGEFNKTLKADNCIFYLSEVTNAWMIDAYNNEDFDVEFNTFMGVIEERPEVGEYVIGPLGSDFTSYFYHYPDGVDVGSFQHEYSTFVQATPAGTMTITKSTEDRIEGSFEYVAYEEVYDDEGNGILVHSGTVNISGSFKAVYTE